MANINFSAVSTACDTLARRIIEIEGHHHGSSFIFDQCMRAFDTTPSAEAITFSVFFNAPVMLPGEATIHRDGRLVCRICEHNDHAGA